jgi:sortase A
VPPPPAPALVDPTQFVPPLPEPALVDPSQFVPPPPAPALVDPTQFVPPLPEPALVEPTESELRTVDRTVRRRRRLLSISTWVRNIGVIIILFALWQLWGTSIDQHHSQDALKVQFTKHVPSKSTTQSVTLIPGDQEVEPARDGTPIAHIQIPTIGVDQYVVEGTTEADLDKGPGHYAGTAVPGQEGNVAIAGHRTTYGAPFNRLDELTLGDSIQLTTDNGERLTYLVTQRPVAVSPSDISVLNDFGDDRLTLTTCTPKYSAAQRLVVVAELKQPSARGASHPTPASGNHPHRYHLQNTSTAGWNMGQLPLVLAVAVPLVLVGLFSRRVTARLRRVGSWLILVPIWAAGIYLLFEVLTGFLPPTL